MTLRNSVSLLLCAGLLAACAGTYEPVIDQRASAPMPGRSSGDYQQDLAECRQLGERANPAGDAAGQALLGAAIGAALGAATGGIVGGLSAGTGAAVGAASGGIIGVASGGAGGVSDQRRIIDNCMRGRGWAVVN